VLAVVAAPGTVLRSRPVDVRRLVLPVRVAARQVLYRSTTARGGPDAVSLTPVPATSVTRVRQS